ncbi:MAG: hypothetical protein ETSY2_19515 [Candidatus Entotheonella gemina]|uniref:DUF433 domain-containing protein n=1 Tax=Candidatus Entotheonella gemina TaxID=1429439 RepID=W4M7X2_9BACT|nr:MAG: hypothetical protein ETSY2_19515 [Candidatus Entotheonella gemina]
MEKSYVTQTQSGYQITASRVSLDSVVHDFLNGLSPESILDQYDTLTLEQVYGAITYYLAHRAEVDDYLQRQQAKFEMLRLQSRTAYPSLYQKLETAQKVQS